MTILDWLFIGCLSVAILFFVIGVICLILSIRAKQKHNGLKKKRPKNKKKRKRWQKMRRQFQIKQKRHIKQFLVLLFLAGLSIGGAFYSRYYQLTNLTSESANTIVQSYFLMGEIKKELTALQEGADAEKTRNKLAELTGLLTTYGANGSSGNLSENGQKLMRRYYSQIREYGTNLYEQGPDRLQQSEIVTAYLEDIKKIEKTQKQIFSEFKINESALNNKQ